MLGFVLRIASSICSSSKQRALKPDNGWLQRQMEACKKRAKGNGNEKLMAYNSCGKKKH